MGIESLYADGIEADIQRKAANPGAVPPTPFSLWSMIASGAKGVPAGGFEGAASIAEQLKVAQSETLRAGRPKVLQDQPDISGRQSADLGFTKDVAERARSTANGFIPPESAHVADQTLFGLTRIGGKAVTALAATGGNPYAAGAILGAEETNTAYQALIAKGIDPNTALKVAGVQGVTAGASIALPMVGPTVKSTVGLGFLGGPGAFMAQEKMAKEILSSAGYHDEASLHNPTDPLGLVLSTVLPAAFGGAHVVKLKGTPKPLAGVPRDADIKGAVALSADEQAISDAFERSAGNLKELREAVAKEKNPANKALLQEELTKQTALAEANVGKHVVERASVTPEAVDAARTRVTQDALRKNLPEHPEAYAEVMRASDEVAAGRMPEVREMPTTTLPEFREWFGASKVVTAAGEPQVVYHGTRADIAEFKALGREGEGSGSREGGLGIWMTDHPGVASNFADFASKGGYHDGGNVVPAYLALRNPWEPKAYSEIRDLIDRHTTFKRAPYRMMGDVIDYEGAKAELRSKGYDGIALRDSKTDADFGVPISQFVALDPPQVKSAIGNSGKFDPNSASLTDPLKPGERNPRSEGRNALDAVEREGNAAREPAKAEAKSEKSPDSQRVAELAKENPRIASALESAKAEAAEEVKTASLVKAALECALSFGA